MKREKNKSKNMFVNILRFVLYNFGPANMFMGSNATSFSTEMRHPNERQDAKKTPFTLIFIISNYVEMRHPNERHYVNNDSLHYFLSFQLEGHPNERQ